MRITRIGALISFALITSPVIAQDAGLPAVIPAPDKNQMSYALGFRFGAGLAGQGLDVDVATIVRGVQDAIAKRDPSVSMQDMARQLEIVELTLRKKFTEERQALAATNKAKSDKFLAENRGKKNIVALPSGIQYRVIEEGNGARASATSEVSVHYRGSLSDGFEFDSSFARGQPVSFKVGEVLPGWQEILPMMKVGDHWTVFLPPDKAYGESGNERIGPNEVLVFDIKLLDVK